MADKPMTVADVRQAMKEQREAALPSADVAADAPVMTVADVRAAMRGGTKPAAPLAGDPEKTLEAETGKDVVQTGKNPPTFVETDKPAPAVPRREADKPKAKS